MAFHLLFAKLLAVLAGLPYVVNADPCNPLASLSSHSQIDRCHSLTHT